MVTIRAFKKSDYPAVQTIYQQGIASGNATFESKVKDWKTWDKVTSTAGRLVAVEAQNTVLGWACLSDVSSRCTYQGVAEVSLYIHQDYNGKGLGSALLKALIEASEAAGYWTLQAKIFPENLASIHIHQKLGFVPMCVHKKIGKQITLKQSIWRDVQLLERRSSRVGLD